MMSSKLQSRGWDQVDLEQDLVCFWSLLVFQRRKFFVLIGHQGLRALSDRPARLWKSARGTSVHTKSSELNCGENPGRSLDLPSGATVPSRLLNAPDPGPWCEPLWYRYPEVCDLSCPCSRSLYLAKGRRCLGVPWGNHASSGSTPFTL